MLVCVELANSFSVICNASSSELDIKGRLACVPAGPSNLNTAGLLSHADKFPMWGLMYCLYVAGETRCMSPHLSVNVKGVIFYSVYELSYTFILSQQIKQAFLFKYLITLKILNKAHVKLTIKNKVFYLPIEYFNKNVKINVDVRKK
jgi:hypothetical protein